MNAAELALRRTGDPKDARYADRIAAILRERGSDIPLPHQSAGPQSHELTPLEVVRFTSEAREALTHEGFVIHELTGRSIRSLLGEGRPVWSDYFHSYRKVEALPSRSSEVAIDPAQLFLPNSNRKTLEEQEQMIRAYSVRLTQEAEIKDIEVVIGEMPDYVDLVFAHHDATGVRLFGKDYGYNCTRTITRTVWSNALHVGNFDDDYGLGVNYWNPNDGNENVFITPLVVPKQ